VGGQWLYIFGGNTLMESFNDLWRVDLEACATEQTAQWEKVNCQGEVSGVQF
jgi:hypothetical protein